MPGPSVRTDIVDVLVFRRGPGAGDVWLLQLRRARQPMQGSWQPVMGHIEDGETAAEAALRELAEETGFAKGRGLRAVWQLESVNTFFMAATDQIVMSPGFAAEVDPAAEPRLDDAHDAHRWVRLDRAQAAFLWPGHRAAVAQIVRELLAPDAREATDRPMPDWLRIELP